MKPHHRQEQIIAQLLEQGSVHILELRDRFQVSEGTIRNDLRALEVHGRLIRTHGGAVPIDAKRPALSKSWRSVSAAPTDGFEPRRAGHWHMLARRAVELINEGDVILLCSSPITQLIAADVLAMKSLVVLTNSIGIAHQLAQNPSHTVLLVGGQLHAGRDALDGPVVSNMIERMRVNKAFITCDGVSASQGFASNDIADAQVKAGMVACADNVIMLAPGELVGKLALMSFAGLSQVHQLITTNDAPADVIGLLMASNVRVSLCGERITEVCADCPPDRKWRIGFANLNEQQDFSVTVRQSLERSATRMGNVELILTDNEGSPQAALDNAHRLIEAKADLVVEYQQDERTNYVLMDMFRTAGMPVVAIDIPMPGAVYFGADNYRAGRIAGEAAASWIREHWQGKLDRIVCLEQSESGSIPAARIQGALSTLNSAFSIKDSDVLHFETHGALDESRSAATQALRNIPWGRKVLFIGINAHSAIGSLEAAEVLGRQSCTAVVSQNVSNRIRRELRRANTMLIGGVDYFPSTYGERVLQLALNILTGASVPPAGYTDHMLVTADNVGHLYPDDSKDPANGRPAPEMKRFAQPSPDMGLRTAGPAKQLSSTST